MNRINHFAASNAQTDIFILLPKGDLPSILSPERPDDIFANVLSQIESGSSRAEIMAGLPESLEDEVRDTVGRFVTGTYVALAMTVPQTLILLEELGATVANLLKTQTAAA